MAGIFPDGGAGGLIVRDPVTGLPITQPDVEGVQAPPLPFSITCDMTALPDTCNVRPENRQINAIISEMLMLASVFDPDGTWDCTQYDNLATMFLAWVASFSSQDIGGQICSVAESDGKEAAAALLYCASAVAHKLPIVGPDSLVTLIQETICAEAPNSFPNTVDDYLLYCRNGVFRKTSAVGFDNFTGSWYQDRGYETRHMARKDGRLWSPNATIPAGTPFVIGTTGQTWYETSPSATPPWNQTTGYLKDSFISKDGKFYAANADIPPDTPFVIGTTGPTWREVDITQAFILPFDATKNYQQYSVFTYNGGIYRATAGPVPAAAFNPASFEFISGEINLYRGAWVQANSYTTAHMVQRNNKLYSPNDLIPGGTAFAEGTTGATWREVSPSPAIPYDPADAYSKDSVIQIGSQFYAANEDIPAGTPFVEGTSGETWRKVTISGTDMILRDFDATKKYASGQVVAYPPGQTAPLQIYRTKATGHGPGGWNAANFDLIGGVASADLFKGMWQANVSYVGGEVVMFAPAGYKNFPLWEAVSNSNSATFNPAHWRLVAESSWLMGYISTRAYNSGDWVLVNGQLYQANSLIPAGTGFAIGYTGATFSPLDRILVSSSGLTTKTLGVGDENIFETLTGAGAKTFTVPTNATWGCPIGTVYQGMCKVGTVTFVGASGVTISGPDNKVTTTAVVNAPFSLLKIAANEWALAGDLS